MIPLALALLIPSLFGASTVATIQYKSYRHDLNLVAPINCYPYSFGQICVATHERIAQEWGISHPNGGVNDQGKPTTAENTLSFDRPIIDLEDNRMKQTVWLENSCDGAKSWIHEGRHVDCNLHPEDKTCAGDPRKEGYAWPGS